MASNRTDAVTLAVLVLGYGAYGVQAWENPPLAAAELIPIVAGFYVAFTLAMIVVHSLVVLVFGSEPKGDPELERAVGWRAGRNGLVAVVSVLWALPFLAALPDAQVLTVQAVVGLLGLSQIVGHASSILYRGLGAGRNQRALAS
jgi:hypothetical protein